MTRYCLPLLVLSSVIAAIFVERFFQKRPAVIYTLILVLTFTSMPYVFRNNFRRLVSNKKQTVFNTSRLEQYFRNDSSLYPPYVQAAGEVAGRQCADVGLYMGFNTWDYPLGVMLQQGLHQKVRLEHVNISDLTPQNYPSGPFRPCALISVYYSEEEILLGKEMFKKVKDFDKTAVYVRSGSGQSLGPVTPKKFSAL